MDEGTDLREIGRRIAHYGAPAPSAMGTAPARGHSGRRTEVSISRPNGSGSVNLSPNSTRCSTR
ncbi:hypothetical protein SAMN05192584_11589 [Streptomyces pini]|uniref:Uncharacterized protein n=1 Tax=Streptomyces pini TaxID=1520580 RepID=A0A1I4G4T4_9ACTN|nr:hypothetical protein SAMN05192584_11589 [Streptomyces pini]